ncbi:MAG: hypothetical protein M3N10_10045 [Actinomycetota bacterium]|nr:hypothetical protein [Actinomycetota bacterium]
MGEERVSRKQFIRLGGAIGVGVAGSSVLAACGGGESGQGGGETASGGERPPRPAAVPRRLPVRRARPAPRWSRAG